MKETQTKKTGKGRSNKQNGGVSVAKNAVNSVVKGSFNQSKPAVSRGAKRTVPAKKNYTKKNFR